jgi:two-component system sensor histidine kinase CpxA
MQMRNLFLKIFLWFWLVIVVVSATVVFSAAVIRSRSADLDRWRQQYVLNVELRAQHASELLDLRGKDAAEKYLRSLDRMVLVNHSASGDRMRNYMFDEHGQEVVGQQVSSQIRSVISQMNQYPPGTPHFFYQERIAADNIRGSRGEVYTFVMMLPEPTMFQQIQQFVSKDVSREGIIQLLEILIVASIFCLLLARHLTTPIDQLRLAARRIADDHLEARVTEDVIKRHDELAELGRDFNRMADRIDSLVHSQRRLLTDVSHELRSPLTRLNLALGLARQQANHETIEHLNRIEDETDRLDKLIGQLLTLARVESGVDLEQKEIFDLGVLVQGVVSDGDFEARSRDCGVKFTHSSECLVEGAFEMLRGALENVVRNAVRHTAIGTHVEVAIDSDPSQPNSKAVIQVHDHGVGIPEKDLAHLFVPFHRASNGARKTSDGAGLGLAIAQRAFQLHGGKVTAANAPGGGLIVTLELPKLDKTEETAKVELSLAHGS